MSSHPCRSPAQTTGPSALALNLNSRTSPPTFLKYCIVCYAPRATPPPPPPYERHTLIASGPTLNLRRQHVLTKPFPVLPLLLLLLLDVPHLPRRRSRRSRSEATSRRRRPALRRGLAEIRAPSRGRGPQRARDGRRGRADHQARGLHARAPGAVHPGGSPHGPGGRRGVWVLAVHSRWYVSRPAPVRTQRYAQIPDCFLRLSPSRSYARTNSPVKVFPRSG